MEFMEKDDLPLVCKWLTTCYSKTNELDSKKERFWSTASIWIFKPQVVDRRIMTSITIAEISVDIEMLINKSFNINDFIETHTRSSIPEGDVDKNELFLTLTESENVEQKTGCSYVEFTNKACDDLICNDSVITFIIRKVLPRQSNRTKPCFDLVIKDFSRTEVSFVRLVQDSNCVCLPDDLNQSWSYKIELLNDNKLSISVSPHYKEQLPVSTLPVLTPPTEYWLSYTLLPKLVKWFNEIDPRLPIKFKNSVISMTKYSELYGELKTKYAEHFVKVWPESTDPQKYVYEDLSIAAYLLVLWEEEREAKHLKEKQSFVDLGCGNGLLVFILSSEGHPGKGIDLRRRKIWDIYGSKACCLEERAITPSSGDLFADYDWLIGNHSDELTPWIPVMAFRSSEKLQYFVLPCCFHDFDKKYMKREKKETQYRSYLNFIREVGETSGFDVKEDTMRIASTKKICQIGYRIPENRLKRNNIDEILQSYIEQRCSVLSSSKDSVKSESTLNHLKKQNPNTHENGSDIQEKWATNFEPRIKIEKVRNCSKLSVDLKNRIVFTVFNALLGSEKGTCENVACENNEDDMDIKKKKLKVTWRKGGSLTLSQTVALFDQETLKELKNNCGGFKTLLRNYYQIFKVTANLVEIRDWSCDEETNIKSNNRNDGAKKEERFKTKQCWFYTNHPDRCPREMEKCPFAHGPDDLRKLSSD